MSTVTLILAGGTISRTAAGEETIVPTCFDVEVSDGVAHLQLCRPDELNTMNVAFWSELPELVRELDADGATRVLVISSTGRHFSAGMDLSVFTGDSSLL